MYKKLIKINFYKNPAILIPFIFFITIFFFWNWKGGNWCRNYIFN